MPPKTKKRKIENQQNSDQPTESDQHLPLAHSTYKASGLKNSQHGVMYQVELLMLFAYFGEKNSYKFRLGTEMTLAEKFDDIVFIYEKGDNKGIRFIQAKHRQDKITNVITMNDLFKYPKGDFSLQKYFLTHQNIKEVTNFQCGINEYIICTNIKLSGVLKKYFHRIREYDDILQGIGKRYRFTNVLQKRKKIVKKLKSKFDIPPNDNDIEIFLNKLIFAVDQPMEDKLHKVISSDIESRLNRIGGKSIVNNFKNEIINWFKQKEGTYFTENNVKEFIKNSILKLDQSYMITHTTSYSEKIRQMNINFKPELIPSELHDFLYLDTKKSVVNLIMPPKLTLLGSIMINQLLRSDDYSKYFSKKGRYFFIQISKFIELLTDQNNQALKQLATNLLIIECNTLDESNLKCLLEFLNKQQYPLPNNKRILLITSDDADICNSLRSNFSDNNYEEIIGICGNEKIYFRYLDSLSQKNLLDRKVTFQGHQIILSALIDDKIYDSIFVYEKIYLGDKIFFDDEIFTKLLNMENISIGKPIQISSGYNKEYYIDRTFNFTSAAIKKKMLKQKQYNFAFSGIKIKKLAEIIDLPLKRIHKKVRWVKTYIIKLMYNEEPSDDSIKDNVIYFYLKNNKIMYKVKNWRYKKVNRIQIDAFDLVKCINLKNVLQGESRNIDLDSNQYNLLANILFMKGYSINDTITNQREKRYVLLNNGNEEDEFDRVEEDEFRCSHTHWLKWESDKLIRQKSWYGNISSFRKYFDEERIFEKEVYCLEKNKFVVISETAGMGKTTLMDHFSIKLKEMYPLYWVFRVNLVDLPDIILRKFLFQSDYQSIADDLMDILNSIVYTKLDTLFEKTLFIKLLELEKVIILFDGVDEICLDIDCLDIDCLGLDYRQLFFEFLRSLSTEAAKLLVTTRPNICTRLENKLEFFAFKLEHFSKQNQIDFLTNYWMNRLKLPDKNRVEFFAEKLLQKISKLITSKEREFAGIPLHTKMLAEVFQTSKNFDLSYTKKDYVAVIGVKEFSNSDTKKFNLPINFNLSNLYEAFFRIKYYNICQEEKKPGEYARRTYDRAYPQFIKDHQMLALYELFPETKVTGLLSEQNIKYCNKFKEEIKEFEENRGIIEQLRSDGTPKFVHRTFAEYLAAKFFVKKLLENDDVVRKFLRKEIFKEENEMIRNFIDRNLAADNKLHLAVLNNDKDRVTELNTLEQNTKLDTQGRSALHLAVSYGYEKLSKLLLKENYNLNAIDDIFNWTPLQYAVRAFKYNTAELLLKKPETNKDIKIYKITGTNSEGKTILHIAVEKNCPNLVTFVVDRAQKKLQRAQKKLQLLKKKKILLKKKIFFLLNNLINFIFTNPDNENSPFGLAVKTNNKDIINILLNLEILKSGEMRKDIARKIVTMYPNCNYVSSKKLYKGVNLEKS